MNSTTYSLRYSRQKEAVLVPEPTPHVLVENDRVYEPDDFGLWQFRIVEASELERAALQDAGFQIGTPSACSARRKPPRPSLLPLDPPQDDDPF